MSRVSKRSKLLIEAVLSAASSHKPENLLQVPMVCYLQARESLRQPRRALRHGNCDALGLRAPTLITRPRPGASSGFSVECPTLRTLLVALYGNDANTPAQDRTQLGIAVFADLAVIDDVVIDLLCGLAFEAVGDIGYGRARPGSTNFAKADDV